MNQRRTTYLALAIGTIIIGLVVHRGGAALGFAAQDIIGDALWASMMVWWISAVLPSAAPPVRGGLAMGVCALVELSQRVHAPSFDAVRATMIGQLVLGSGFDPRDFASYGLGVVVAVAVDINVVRRGSVLMLVRHLLSIAALPFTMTVLIPIWIARMNHTVMGIGATPLEVGAQCAGVVVLLVGLTLFGSSLFKFITEGKGTLAPWDPPRQFVATGPYRYVRNPMISGVIFIVLGEGLVLVSMPHVEWAATFFVINLIYIPLLEEPPLKERFGEPYIEYCKHVRRFLPRLTPWVG